MSKPNWWPKNPYPEDIFPMKRERYLEIVPDENERTALSRMLGREYWGIASESIYEVVSVELNTLRDFILDEITGCNRSIYKSNDCERIKLGRAKSRLLLY